MPQPAGRRHGVPLRVFAPHSIILASLGDPVTDHGATLDQSWGHRIVAGCPALVGPRCHGDMPAPGAAWELPLGQRLGQIHGWGVLAGRLRFIRRRNCAGLRRLPRVCTDGDWPMLRRPLGVPSPTSSRSSQGRRSPYVPTPRSSRRPRQAPSLPMLPRLRHGGCRWCRSPPYSLHLTSSPRQGGV